MGNAVEIDVQYTKTAEPAMVWHGDKDYGVCDCTCHSSSFLPSWLQHMCPASKYYNVCDALRCSNSAKKTCHAATTFAPILHQVARERNLKMLYIDNKLEATGQKSATTRRAAGLNLAKAVKKHLFDKGYRGKVIINCYNTPWSSQLLTAAYSEISKTRYNNHVWYAADGGDYVKYATLTMQWSKAYLKNMKLAYVGGISTC